MKSKRVRTILRIMRKALLVQFVGTFVCALCSGCASTGYLGDRMRDAGDVFTATVGMGAGAKARVGPVQAGALYNIDMWGLRGGDFGDVPWYETCTRDALFPVPARWVGYPPMESGRFGDERFACGCKRSRSWQRGKSFAAKAPLPFIGVAKQPEYYTQIEIVVGVLGSIRLGFNPGELLDFILGWTTLDIYDDDLEKRKTIEQAESTVPSKAAPSASSDVR
jgi:hypothetical protein